MKVRPEHYKNIKSLPREEMVTPGSSLCAGCGGLTTLRLFHKALGENVVIVNAAGCMTLLATYPYTPLRSSWLYTTMGSPAAGAQGIRDALDILRAKHAIPESEDLRVLVLAGDGSTYDMGLSATSGAMQRGLDFWYLCYDNESYGNTGFQKSASSPFGSVTATSPSVRATPEGTSQMKKDLFEIWRSHRPPYVATVCSHEPVDLAEKVYRSLHIRGPKLFLSLAQCPTGWGFDPKQGEELARLAVETGLWPLKEAVNGDLRHTVIPKPRIPVEEFLRPQLRFRHLFSPQRQEETLARIQERIDAYWEKVSAEEHGFAKSRRKKANP